MTITRRSHTLTYDTHRKRDVRSSHREIIQLSNQPSIPLRITKLLPLSWEEFNIRIHRSVNRFTSHHSCLLKNV
uniref:Putative ovule protein n=1 Tax=Solanum chacoense TaxID=4108 RepID=A0A0V0GPT8_SOLCH